MNTSIISTVVFVLGWCWALFSFSTASSIFASPKVSDYPVLVVVSLPCIFSILFSIGCIMRCSKLYLREPIKQLLGISQRKLGHFSIVFSCAASFLAISLAMFVPTTSAMPFVRTPKGMMVHAVALFVIGLQFGVLAKSSERVSLRDFLWPITGISSLANLAFGAQMTILGLWMIITGSGAWKYTPLVEDQRFAIPGAMLVFVGTYLMSSCWDVRKSE
jgi:hypothetical protein